LEKIIKEEDMRIKKTWEIVFEDKTENNKKVVKK